MLHISIVSRQGVSVDAAGAQFGEDGGTIGRADTNKLVLDDPDRTVSRVHAQIVCRAGAYAIIDRGSNPLQLNGRPIGAGNEALLNAGDRLLVGGFELLVSLLREQGTPAAVMAAPAEPVTAVEDPFSICSMAWLSHLPGRRPNRHRGQPTPIRLPGCFPTP